QGERLDPSHVDDSIASSEHWFEALPPQDTPRWRSLSEFVEDSDIWGDADLFSRIEVAYPFSNMITFHSLSYRVVTQSLPAPSVADQKDRRPTVVRSERIIAGDRGKPETVSFRYLGLNNWNKEDKDIKFAVPADKVIDLSERVLKTANRNPTLPHYEGPTYQDSPRDSGLLNAQLRSRRERKGSPTSINQPHPAAIDGESHPGSAASSLGASEN
ncbi:hypothetical protein HYR69_02770, partial [Candidatus Sumerlaeota bacterium]|nr:hypothetical protein [Candidatus Sumerlaeota bacterium]